MGNALNSPSPDGPVDYTNQYNTPLTPEQEAAYQQWGQQQAQQTGRNPATDTFDYDMRGFWKNGGQFSANGHAGDTYKKPNHPTFSTYSQYNTQDNQGGVWSGGQNGQPWVFTPSQNNLKSYPPDQLMKYFQREERGNQLNLPSAKRMSADDQELPPSISQDENGMMPMYQTPTGRPAPPIPYQVEPMWIPRDIPNGLQFPRVNKSGAIQDENGNWMF